MKFTPGTNGQIRCLHPDTKLLVGLIQKVSDTEWRIELFMKIDGRASTQAEAVAFAKGTWAMAEAYAMFKKPTGPLIQDVVTKGGPLARPQTKTA